MPADQREPCAAKLYSTARGFYPCPNPGNNACPKCGKPVCGVHWQYGREWRHRCEGC
jgi:hypothetical protein